VSSPKSTPRGEDALESAVASGVVGPAIMPTAPDDADPGAGEDACGVRVRLTQLTMVAVELSGR
jgi:hypothetical protein